MGSIHGELWRRLCPPHPLRSGSVRGLGSPQGLGAGLHRCPAAAHPGPCGACGEAVGSRCFCGRLEQEVPCGSDPARSGFACDEPCGRALACSQGFPGSTSVFFPPSVGAFKIDSSMVFCFFLFAKPNHHQVIWTLGDETGTFVLFPILLEPRAVCRLQAIFALWLPLCPHAFLGNPALSSPPLAGY